MNTAHSPEIAETVYRLDGPLRWALGEVQDLLRAVGAAPGQQVIDVGAGTGYAAVPAARAVGPQGSVHCVDGSPELLDVLASRAAREGVADRVTRTVGSVVPLPAADDSADLVISTYVLHELADDAPAAIAEMHRVLRPGGRVALADYRKTADKERNREIEAWYARQPDGAGPEEVHLRFSLGELEEMLRAAGFHRIELRTWHDFHVHATAEK